MNYLVRTIRHSSLLRALAILGVALLCRGPATGQSIDLQPVSLSRLFSNGSIRTLYPAPDGRLWLGAESGLYFYDGQTTRFYPRPDSAEQTVSAVYQDHRRRLWVGYADGYICRLQADTLAAWEPEEGRPVQAITGFAEDERGQLWIATYGEGVYCRARNGRLYNFNTDDGLTSNDIYQLAAAPDGSIWLATDAGISITQLYGERKSIRPLTRADGLPDDIVQTFHCGKKGMWIGTHDGGFCQYEWDSRRFRTDCPDWNLGPITTLVEISETLWIGTLDRGLWRYDRTTGELRTGADTPAATGRIYDLGSDAESNLWLAGSTVPLATALTRFEFRYLDSLPDVQTLLIDRHNGHWLGTVAGLYYRRAGTATYQLQPGTRNWNILSLHEDRFGRIWTGTFDLGVFYRTAAGWRQRTEAAGLWNNNVLQISGSGELLWLATLGGVSRIRLPDRDAAPEVTNYSRSADLSFGFIYEVLPDERGGIWLATDGSGLGYLSGTGRTEYFTQVVVAGDTLAIRTVYSLTLDRQGVLWFSTGNHGVIGYRNGRFRRLDHGPDNELIASLTTDSLDNLIVVHRGWVDLFDPDRQHLLRFGETVGLADFDPGLNAIDTDPAGTIWLAGRDRLVRYLPLPGLQLRPRLILEEISASLETLSTGQRELPPDRNNLIFRYAGLWYTDPEAVSFRYRLDGQDQNWIETRDRQATYSSLPPGEYRFRLEAGLNGRFDTATGLDYPFRILRPIWQRWWFVSAVVALLGFLTWYLLHRREQQRLRWNELQNARVRSELAALKSQVNPHFLFNSFNTLIATIETDPQVAVEYVEQLSDFYRGLLQFREADLISLAEELRLTRNYLFLLRKRYGDNLQVEERIDDSTGMIAPLTIQMLVENAVKHNVISRDAPLRICLHREQHYFEVSNTLQAKTSPEESTGFGLAAIQRRYRLLAGKSVEIETTSDKFSARIPILYP